jgi:hypothetical protein
MENLNESGFDVFYRGHDADGSNPPYIFLTSAP